MGRIIGAVLFLDQMVYYPDERLRWISQPLDLLSQAREAERLDELLCAVLAREKGLGLSAIQIGVPWQMFVMYVDLDFNIKPLCFINPTIISYGETSDAVQEGCLSIPGLIVQLKRPQSILIEYQDLQGERHRKELFDLAAVCAQHEMDHLRGILILDYLRKQDRRLFADGYRVDIGSKTKKPNNTMTFIGEIHANDNESKK